MEDQTPYLLDSDLGEAEEYFLNAIEPAVAAMSRSLFLAWPSPGAPADLRTFANFEQWKRIILATSLKPGVPTLPTLKFWRAQKLYLLGWLDMDLIKAGELQALAALEFTVRDQYGGCFPRTKKQIKDDWRPTFAMLLKYMVTDDHLTDDKLPIVQRCGGSVIGGLTGDRRPTLADIRNEQAHGQSLDGLLIGGLLDVIHDLIEYAYRNRISVYGGAAQPT